MPLPFSHVHQWSAPPCITVMPLPSSHVHQWSAPPCITVMPLPSSHVHQWSAPPCITVMSLPSSHVHQCSAPPCITVMSLPFSHVHLWSAPPCITVMSLPFSHVHLWSAPPCITVMSLPFSHVHLWSAPPCITVMPLPSSHVHLTFLISSLFDSFTTILNTFYNFSFPLSFSSTFKIIFFRHSSECSFSQCVYYIFFTCFCSLFVCRSTALRINILTYFVTVSFINTYQSNIPYSFSLCIRYNPFVHVFLRYRRKVAWVTCYGS